MASSSHCQHVLKCVARTALGQLQRYVAHVRGLEARPHDIVQHRWRDLDLVSDLVNAIETGAAGPTALGGTGAQAMRRWWERPTASVLSRSTRPLLSTQTSRAQARPCLVVPVSERAYDFCTYVSCGSDTVYSRTSTVDRGRGVGPHRLRLDRDYTSMMHLCFCCSIDRRGGQAQDHFSPRPGGDEGDTHECASSARSLALPVQPAWIGDGAKSLCYSGQPPRCSSAVTCSRGIHMYHPRVGRVCDIICRVLVSYDARPSCSQGEGALHARAAAMVSRRHQGGLD